MGRLPEDPVIVRTKDGSQTLYLKDLDEHYHSHHGALTESMHVFIDAGLNSVPKNHINLLEIGFGTGLNALLTLTSIQDTDISVHYTGMEKYPLNKELLRSLNHSSLIPEVSVDNHRKMIDSGWGTETIITPQFTLLKLERDVCSMEFSSRFDLVYFDAFAPDKQPELWTIEVFSRIYQCMQPGSILTTYSSKGQIRRNMKDAGFRVEKLPGPPGKRDMTRAFKD